MTGQEHKDATLRGVNLCGAARKSGLTELIKRGDEAEHHPQAIELIKFLETLDTLDYDSHFGWIWNRKEGEDGEILLSQLDIYFQQKDRENEL